jgi:hypothetical protein
MYILQEGLCEAVKQTVHGEASCGRVCHSTLLLTVIP